MLGMFGIRLIESVNCTITVRETVHRRLKSGRGIWTTRVETVTKPDMRYFKVGNDMIVCHPEAAKVLRAAIENQPQPILNTERKIKPFEFHGNPYRLYTPIA